MSRMLEAIYETAKDMHECGMIDANEMREFEIICRENRVPKFAGKDVKKIRKRLDLSQDTLASVINAKTSTVRSWESGASKPSGASCLLLDIINRKGVEAVW